MDKQRRKLPVYWHDWVEREAYADEAKALLKAELEVKAERFTKLMPEDARKLRRAVLDGWPNVRVAKEIEVSEEDAKILLERTRDAMEMLNTATPAEAFRVAIRQLMKHAATEGMDAGDDGAIEELVTQVCYRVSDLSCLLQNEDLTLADMCLALRREPDEHPEDFIQ